VLDGVKAEIVQLAGPQLAQLQLGVGAKECDRWGHCHQLVQLRLRLAQHAQLRLDVQAHLGGLGWGGRGRRRRHLTVLQSQQQEWQFWQMWLLHDHVWRGGGDRRVLGDGGVHVEGEGDADGVAGAVADDVVDGEALTAGESVLFQRGIQC
jgi:hypothetical protein